MTKRLLDLSGEIDTFILDLLENIARVAESLSAPFFVVGATARDIVLKYGYGIETIRATNDIDLGVQVSGWDQYIAADQQRDRRQACLPAGLAAAFAGCEARSAEQPAYDHPQICRGRARPRQQAKYMVS
jgi:hypothetical protein